MTDLSQLSPQEIDRLRALLSQQDNQGKIKEFDLNNPPKEPYKYEEFPRIVYHHDKRTYKKVHSQKQLEAALSEGHQLEPYPSEAPEPEQLSAAEQAEVAALDKKARQPKQK